MSITRLIDMGVEPYLLSSSLLGAQAQRLVRKLCPHCKRQDADGHWHPVGCAECGHAGYKGCTGVYGLRANCSPPPVRMASCRCAKTVNAWWPRASPRWKKCCG